ncbi:MAG TPA: phasin family protein [Lysobacter sp.]|nr:phasin family protein [Lysobacter sp.]
MYPFNDQLSAATRQFADAAAQVNRLALKNAEAVIGLQLAALEDRMSATFAFLTEATEARDLDACKTLWPKGVQVARENVERAVTTAQEVLGRTLKTQESIAELAKAQYEANAARVQDTVQKATKGAAKQAEPAAR